MSIEELEIQWRTGARHHRLHIDAEGSVRVEVDGQETHPPPRQVPEPAASTVPRAEGPGRRGKAWTEEEEDILRRGFDAAESPADLGRRIGRTRGAVAARLVRLGLITEEEAGLRYPVAKPPSEASTTPGAPPTTPPGAETSEG